VEHPYDSFGKQTASSGSMTNPFQYQFEVPRPRRRL